MYRMIVWIVAVAAAVGMLAPATAVAADVNIDAYIKKDRFGTLKISPTGEYYAATVPVDNKTALVLMRRGDNKLTGTFQLGKNTHVADFWWVNPTRVLISMSEKIGDLDEPRLTGDIYAINADGTQPDLLVGQSNRGAGLDTRIQPKKVEMVAAFLVDDLPKDDDSVIVSVMPFTADPYTRADRMDVYSGRRVTVARAPVRNARFTTDHDGLVRFARGIGSNNNSMLYYRSREGGEWTLVNDEDVSNRVEYPIGFSDDNATAYIAVEQEKGPDKIMAMDIASGKRTVVLEDDNTDPAVFLYTLRTRAPVGAMFMDGKPRTAFFDETSAEARLYHSLEAAFEGQSVFITSATSDGKLSLVQVEGDRNPGDFFVFDTVAKKADHVISRRDWFEPGDLAEVRPIALKARDGVALAGYLTVPRGTNGKNLPMVVLPHGGPFHIYDQWGFDEESQLLAAAGYAVLQVNYRGSGNHGRWFTQAGAREWGGAMQDDVTDATRWAIQQGIANPERICIYGASYGAYASLMGVAKEPALYRCAAGYVGVYDLPMMQSTDARNNRRFGTWSNDWVGERSALAGVSPNRLADRIKVPVFLAAGGEDERAPIEHSKMMEKALVAAGVPVETMYFPTEGHGFYVEANRKAYYTKLLAFLARNLRTGTTGTAVAGGE